MRAAVLDIETLALDAQGAGWVLLAVIKPLDRPPIVFRYDKYRCTLGHEGPMLEAIFSELELYDIIIGHNVEEFDWNFLKSRAITEKVDIPSKPIFYDTLKAAKASGLLTIRNYKGYNIHTLEVMCDFLGIEQLKTKILPREHWKTVWGRTQERAEAMHRLEDHCIRDCRMTEELFGVLLAHERGYITFRRIKH